MWGFGLIGYYAPRKPSFHVTQAIVNDWSVKPKIYPDVHGWLVFRFRSQEDLDIVLCKGVYQKFGFTLVLKPLPKWCTFGDDVYRSAPVWVKLSPLPIEAWNDAIIGMLALEIGKPIATDKLTRNLDAINYARCLVEVDVSRELCTTLELELPNGEIVNIAVDYENKPKYCHICKRIGHTCCTEADATRRKEQILAQKAKDVKKKTVVQVAQEPTKENPPIRQEWRTVNRKNKFIPIQPGTDTQRLQTTSADSQAHAHAVEAIIPTRDIATTSTCVVPAVDTAVDAHVELPCTYKDDAVDTTDHAQPAMPLVEEEFLHADHPLVSDIRLVHGRAVVHHLSPGDRTIRSSGDGRSRSLSRGRSRWRAGTPVR